MSLTNDLHKRAMQATNPQVQAMYLEAAAAAQQGDLQRAQKVVKEIEAYKAQNQERLKEKNQARKDARREERRAERGGGGGMGLMDLAGDEEDTGWWEEDPTDYVALLRQQIGNARGAVEAQFAAALADIAAREAASNQAAALLPGELTAKFDAAGASLRQNMGALDAAQEASGLQALMPSSQTMIPLEQALAQEHAANLAAADMTKLGIGTMYGSQRADIQQQKMAALADIAQQEDSMIMSALADERERQFRARQAMAEREFEAPEIPDLTAYGRREVSLARGGDMVLSQANPHLYEQGKTQFAPSKAEAIRQGGGGRTKTYKKASKLLSGVQNQKQFLAAMQALQSKKKYRRRPNASSLALADSGLANLYLQG